MKYYVYVLYSEFSNCYYVGQTNNIERRIIEHNSRSKKYTSKRGPWKLLYEEEFETRSEAMNREKYFKTGKGREFWKRKVQTE